MPQKKIFITIEVNGAWIAFAIKVCYTITAEDELWI